ncbi:aminoglycoside phosphotransferase family protein [Primorskyibacter flagellatus]|uniref:Phosphotransferase enzyme family protein n=1 Tax=Primorskyibacter flagellatus TaxID=1387277 RepID=A0A1W2DJ29_9RHOB|nr:aminoglycoside phosphotransferase family protein [Primorskyibacter flagellatus]SMC96946.1 Phosphotransferase enzyme family protein [Primorskyibacter flagellatus]
MRPGRQLSELEIQSERAFGDFASGAGLPRTGWTLTRLSKRDDPAISRISYLAEHEDCGRFTYKYQLRPLEPHGFTTEYRMQSTAFDLFPHSDHLTVPEPVYLDARQQASLMTYIEGRPLSEFMREASFDRAAQLVLLEHAGRWLDAYHRAGGPETRGFQPQHTVGYYQRLRNQITTGEIKVAAKPLFLKGIAKLAQLEPGFQGRETVSAVQHGDFHMRNLIFDGHRMACIDFSKDQRAPVGFDIGKILLDYTSILRSEADLRPGQVIPDDAMEAFFRGYTLVGRNDPSVEFLLYARILATLVHVPQKQSDRTDAKQRTLIRLRPIAQKAFSPGMSGRTTRARPGIRLYLTSKSLERARHGEHEVYNAIQEVGRQTGTEVTLSRNAPKHRQSEASAEMSLVHMSEPIGRNGLVFRRLYAGTFWQFERCAARWQWQSAKALFDPGKIDAAAAATFFDDWQERLFGRRAKQASRDGFIYMPLQGRLMQHRSFQSTSPIKMIEEALQNSSLPIVATLHPNESYSDAEQKALDALQAQYPRFRVENMGMEEALATCDLVVTQNSSAAFHAMFFGKPSVLFAGVDFHHICANVPKIGVSEAFAQAKVAQPEFAKYIYWFWKMNAIDLEDNASIERLISRLNALGWKV